MPANDTFLRRDARSGETELAQLKDLQVGLHLLYARKQLIVQKIQATFSRSETAWRSASAALDAGSRVRQRQPTAEDRQRLLEHSEYARLVARLETMPMIEQAKGIIMAQSHCSAEEAFDLLRQASQRSNVPVRNLAAKIVSGAVRSGQLQPSRSAGHGLDRGLSGDGAVPSKNGGFLKDSVN